MWMLYLYVSRTTYNLMLDKPHFLGSIVQRKVMFINNEQLKKNKHIGINIRLKSYRMKNPLRKEGN